MIHLRHWLCTAAIVQPLWVITGTPPAARLYDLQPFWQRVRARASLNDVRIHDLRHTFASMAVATGQGWRSSASYLATPRCRRPPLCAFGGRPCETGCQPSRSRDCEQPKRQSGLAKTRPVSEHYRAERHCQNDPFRQIERSEADPLNHPVETVSALA